MSVSSQRVFHSQKRFGIQFVVSFLAAPYLKFLQVLLLLLFVANEELIVMRKRKWSDQEKACAIEVVLRTHSLAVVNHALLKSIGQTKNHIRYKSVLWNWVEMFRQ